MNGASIRPGASGQQSPSEVWPTSLVTARKHPASLQHNAQQICKNLITVGGLFKSLRLSSRKIRHSRLASFFSSRFPRRGVRQRRLLVAAFLKRLMLNPSEMSKRKCFRNTKTADSGRTGRSALMTPPQVVVLLAIIAFGLCYGPLFVTI